MLTPTSASASQKVAVTPGWLRMPAPTSETLPMWSSYSTLVNPISSCSEASFCTAVDPASREQVKVMSVLPSSTLEMFCSTMSMLTSASATARKTLAA